MDFSIQLGVNDEVWISTLSARASERIEPAKSLVFKTVDEATHYVSATEAEGFTFAGKERLR